MDVQRYRYEAADAGGRIETGVQIGRASCRERVLLSV